MALPFTGCQSNEAPSAVDGGGGAQAIEPAAGGSAGSAGEGGIHADCATQVLGIASAPLDASPPLKLVETTQLLGDGLAATLMPLQNVTAGLRWQGDRMFLPGDSGFWEIPMRGTPRWYPTSSILVAGMRAGDFDGDGDQDLVVLSTSIDPTAATGGGSPLVSRLTAWERTGDGLTERGFVLQANQAGLPMPFAVCDVDGDKALDVVTFQGGAPIGFMNAGKLTFTQTMLSDPAPDYRGFGALLLDCKDRDDDGAPDLLVVAGDLGGNELENTIFVVPGVKGGRFGMPGPGTKGMSPLVPYGPDGDGLGIADVTGDGLADVVIQDPQSGTKPLLRLYASTSPRAVAPAMLLDGLGFAFADVDADGKLDILTARSQRLQALLTRPTNAYEVRDLGIDVSTPALMSFTTGASVFHALYKLPACPDCGSQCSNRCLFGACVACLSDADCATGRCSARACAP